MKKIIAVLLMLLSITIIAGEARGQKAIKTVPFDAGMKRNLDFAPSTRAGGQVTDQFGVTHTRYRQMYQGLPVFGAEIIEHSRKGQASTTGRMAIINGLKTRPSLSRAIAQETVSKLYGQSPFSAELVVYPSSDGVHLTWLFSEQAHDSRWQVFVDAHTGEIINSYNDIQHGTGTGVLGDTKSLDTTYNGSTYQLVASDNSRATYDAKTRTRLPGTLMTDSDDVWTDGAAVDAHHYAGLVLDYYFEQFGRNSYDDQGAQIKSTVHYNRNYVNAFWNGSQMVYGDGDGVNSLALSGGFDVVAHEISHAVTSASSGLIYQNESGALNEAFSDIMGSAAEYYKQSSQFDWMMGEDIWTPGIAGDALRYMDDPTADGSSTDHYDDRYTGSSDNGGVHWNSGIANLAFVLAVQGGSHPTYGGSYTGVGMDAASQIFYTAFTQYLSSSATFADARAACVQVATDNYDAITADRIDQAWQAVGAPSGGGTGGPTVITVAPGDTFQSDHPYGHNENITWEVSSPGAASITLNFSQMDMERNYDYVYVKDGNDNVLATYTGKYSQNISITVSGDVARVNLVSDASVAKQGFTGVGTAN